MQLRDKKGKYISNETLEKMDKKELDEIVEYNIKKYDWKPDDEEGKKTEDDTKAAEKPAAPKTMIFGSTPAGLRIKQDGFDIEFNEGRYTTSDEKEIEFLKDKAENRNTPFSKVAFLGEEK